MYDQLQAIEDRYEELGELLSDPEVISDTQRFMQLSKEEANTRDTVATYRRYKKVVEGISDAEELLGENLDAEMAEMAKE
jgi:peptide chain release factor 1